ncbi:MAG TPA: hypothetical protein PK317_01450 [Coprothermobacter proteolyticus]|nr:hypothetical protein [Coprothermobacter proteolyticus]
MKHQPEGRFEVKPRNKSLNQALRRSRCEEHDMKHGDQQKRSRLTKHFKHEVEHWLDEGDDYDSGI